YRKLSVSDRACPVSSVDLNDLFNESCRVVGEKFLKCYLTGSKERVREKLEKVLKDKGLKPHFQYNPASGNFSWKFDFAERPDTDQPTRPKTSIPKAHSPREDQGMDTRSKSATVAKSFDVGRRRLGIYTELPENIQSLGFRRPSKKSVRKQVKSAPIVSEQCKIHFVQEPEITQSDPNIQIVITNKEKDVTTEPPEKNSEIESGEEEAPAQYEDLCLPSVYLRKKPAEKQPLTVCFSLKDNENLTHKELKNHIEAEMGVKVMRLQYEPLSVRSGDPSVNGRWLATMRNLFEVDTLLRKGFYMNGNHMIVKRWDEICEKEYRNYRYMQDINNERERLNLPSSKSSRKFFKGCS
ncbi:uncharacterized protein LOC134229249, partial [Saccostrea cucullata]|uniref:uncharacterized protein LOC134229249 n=1 Tax=Saccostrea cuccullata TaxID=36930 RepID=UPI002ED61CFF